MPAEINLFIFRRDLRFHDNTALIRCVNTGRPVALAFIFDPRQLEAPKNKWRSQASIKFMVESLEALEMQGAPGSTRGPTINYFTGPAEDVVERILEANEHIKAVYFNKDYTPFSIKRDKAIEKACKAHGVALHTFHDTLILDGPKTKKDGTPYLVFGPYYKFIKGFKPSAPRPVPAFKTVRINIDNGGPSKNTGAGVKNSGEGARTGLQYIQGASNISATGEAVPLAPIIKGGRANGLKLLAKIPKRASYTKNRDFLAYETTLLSAHNKFGTISPRELYKTATASDPTLAKEIFWREFFYTLMIYDKRVLKGSYTPKYDRIRWKGHRDYFDAWVNGETGFPVVDACMRQLNAQNYMHNRGRMIVASFLIKNMQINWRHGENYFATKLVDYDPAQNNYNWQTVGGFGPFAMPYFRVFSTVSQSKRFDPDCEYIKKWVPELTSLRPEAIHNWPTKWRAHIDKVDYFEPILDEKATKAEWVKRFRKA